MVSARILGIAQDGPCTLVVSCCMSRPISNYEDGLVWEMLPLHKVSAKLRCVGTGLEGAMSTLMSMSIPLSSTSNSCISRRVDLDDCLRLHARSGQCYAKTRQFTLSYIVHTKHTHGVYIYICLYIYICIYHCHVNMHASLYIYVIYTCTCFQMEKRTS